MDEAQAIQHASFFAGHLLFWLLGGALALGAWHLEKMNPNIEQ